MSAFFCRTAIPGCRVAAAEGSATCNCFHDDGVQRLLNHSASTAITTATSIQCARCADIRARVGICNQLWPCDISDAQRDPGYRLHEFIFLPSQSTQRLERARHVGRGVTRPCSVSKRGKHYQHFSDIAGCPWRHGHGSRLWVCGAHHLQHAVQYVT